LTEIYPYQLATAIIRFDGINTTKYPQFYLAGIPYQNHTQHANYQ